MRSSHLNLTACKTLWRKPHCSSDDKCYGNLEQCWSTRLQTLRMSGTIPTHLHGVHNKSLTYPSPTRRCSKDRPQKDKHHQRALTVKWRITLIKGHHTHARALNLLKPNDIYICRTAALTSRRYMLNIYSTNIHTEYFKHAA